LFPAPLALRSHRFGDSLGTLAVQGHDSFCRQALVGGNYALLQTTAPPALPPPSSDASVEPRARQATAVASSGILNVETSASSGAALFANPDLYTAILWRHIMGPVVLSALAAADTDGVVGTDGVSETGTHGAAASGNGAAPDSGAAAAAAAAAGPPRWAQGGNGTQGNLRAYAHCACDASAAFGEPFDVVLGTEAFPPGAMALLLLNLDSPDGGPDSNGAAPRRVLLGVDVAAPPSQPTSPRSGRLQFARQRQRRLEWHLTGPGGATAHALAVNGIALTLAADGSLALPLPPPVEVLPPAPRTAGGTAGGGGGSGNWNVDEENDAVALAPLSAAFVVLPDADVPACM